MGTQDLHKVVVSCPIWFPLHHQLLLLFCSMLCERGWRGKWWFWRKITQTACYNIILCSVTWLGTRICIPWKILLFKKETKIVSKSEREKHSLDKNKNSVEIMIMSISFNNKFKNTMVLYSRKRFKNWKYSFLRMPYVSFQFGKKPIYSISLIY